MTAVAGVRFLPLFVCVSGFPHDAAETQGSHKLSGNLVNLEKSGNLRYGQGIFYDMSHGSRLAYDKMIFACNV